MKKLTLFSALAALAISILLLSPIAWRATAQNQNPAASQTEGTAGGVRLAYPTTKTVDTVDDYFGTRVPDPYRWLEDDNSPEVAAWVEAQNKVTFSYLQKTPYRQQVRERLEKLLNYPK